MIEGYVIGACAGAVGGLIKSVLEHKGELKLPYKDNDVVILGCVLDIIGGAAIGLSFAEPTVYKFFGFAQPGIWLSFISGLSWLAIIQRLIGRLPLKNATNGGNGTINARKIIKKGRDMTLIVPLL